MGYSTIVAAWSVYIEVITYTICRIYVLQPSTIISEITKPLILESSTGLEDEEAHIKTKETNLYPFFLCGNGVLKVKTR